jgi:NHL repeat
VITTIAGSGRAGFGGDGKPATAAELNTPQKIAIAKDGSIFVADRANHRVRKIDARGIITTVVGEGE